MGLEGSKYIIDPLKRNLVFPKEHYFNWIQPWTIDNDGNMIAVMYTVRFTQEMDNGEKEFYTKLKNMGLKGWNNEKKTIIEIPDYKF